MSGTYGAWLSTKLVAEGRSEEAIAAANEELAAVADDPEILFNRGQAQAALGRYDRAVADFEAALVMDTSASSLDPEALDDELFHVLRTWATARRDEPDAALMTIRRYRSLLPAGRHLDDIGKWEDSLRGVQAVWYRERV